MSNIVLKGDVVQNLGEYLPNVYIESVRVSDQSTTQISLAIDYSILFLIDDEYDINDISQNLQDINIMFAFARSSDVFKKQQVVDGIVDEVIGERGEKARESYSFNIEQIDMDSIFDRIGDGDYIDNLYDDQDRRILKINASHTKFLSKITYNSNNLYCYTFTSIASLSSLESSAKDVVYLNTSNISYEKILSPGLNVLRDEELIYLDSQGAKYGQVPLLGLNRQYYKTTTVTREEVISKVNTLVRRFDRLSVGPLSDSVAAIKYVLSTQADTENLLVELDKVRRSFPNKTNNNPVGNLYASYTKLLQNINSAFLPSEIVTKERYLTGKVFDLRTGLTRGYERPEPTDSPSYIPEGMFFIHRERKSEDDIEDDLAINRGVFFIRYEEMLKRESNIGNLINIDKFYETVSDQDLDDLKRILFSYFRIKNVNVNKKYNGNLMSFIGINYGQLRDNRESKLEERVELDQFSEFNGIKSVHTEIKEYNFAFDNPSERMLCYSFTDSDTFSAIYEENEIDINGAMIFDYEISAAFHDETNRLVTFLIDKFDDIKDSLDQYASLAQEICSYNNIDNRFNDFFVNSIREQFPTGVYPWESAPAIYAVMAYVLTTNFETFEDAIRYSKNVTATISPENGSLDSLVDFQTRLDNLKTQQITALEDANDEPAGERLVEPLNKQVALKPLNYVQLLSEADAEFESLFREKILYYNQVDLIVDENGTPYLKDGSPVTNVVNTRTKSEFMQLLLAELEEFFLLYTFDFGQTGDLSTTQQVDLGTAIDIFIQQIQSYFRNLRNDNLKTNGFRFFQFGTIGSATIEEENVKRYTDLFLTRVETVYKSIDGSRELPSREDFYFTQLNAIVNLIYNYYNSPRIDGGKQNLQYDISIADFALIGVESQIKNWIVLPSVFGGSSLPAGIGNYTGPELNEIAGYEDIVVRDN